MLEKKLRELRKYINESLKKIFIRKFKSSAEYLVIFVFKKNKSLRPYIDYRKLNNITIKNRYLLPKISEMRDRFGKAKIFIKLDLRGAYNLIKIKKIRNKKLHSAVNINIINI